MRKHFITINLICTMLAIGCSIFKTHKKMEKLDILTFEKNYYGGDYSYTLSNGDKVQQTRGNGDIAYIERIKKASSPFSSYKEFFSNGSLKREGQSFFGFFSGIHNEYDQKGNLINQINFDEGFPFSIESLIVKIKNEFHVDIMNDNYVNVYRQFRPSVYVVTFPPDQESLNSKLTVIRIDAVTGSVISNDTINRE